MRATDFIVVAICLYACFMLAVATWWLSVVIGVLILLASALYLADRLTQ
jgi:hypothetical protein